MDTSSEDCINDDKCDSSFTSKKELSVEEAFRLLTTDDQKKRKKKLQMMIKLQLQQLHPSWLSYNYSSSTRQTKSWSSFLYFNL